MRCTPAERDLKKRFVDVYDRALTPAMQAIERRVCGCDYGGNSWLSRRQADHFGSCLGLKAGMTLLDLGAGSGWPALYLAKRFGCDVMLVDLPENGLRFARDRAMTDGIAGRVRIVLADAAELPFAPASFDAISHCDLLCCLVRKRAVLEKSRSVIRPDGRMAFTVISIAPGLSSADRHAALETSPTFVECETDYTTLLQETGWAVSERTDITPAYEAACRRQIEADEASEAQLVELLGREDFIARLANWRNKLTAIRRGLVIRERYVAHPDGPRQHSCQGGTTAIA
ncbi:SAM-dependent methyltransferase [Roseibium sp.]|uniref:SAM-dependent methyltransferase n=1 Tax=Roseibium sp. TaxID=1936156 RepID=UPI003D0A05E0